LPGVFTVTAFVRDSRSREQQVLFSTCAYHLLNRLLSRTPGSSLTASPELFTCSATGKRRSDGRYRRKCSLQ
jgi:hypothetical protein